VLEALELEALVVVVQALRASMLALPQLVLQTLVVVVVQALLLPLDTLELMVVLVS
jgi:hypothetical protein